MCGISGLLNFDSGEPVHASVVRRMSSSMNHRGPDDRGEYISGRVGLGFNRLSIIDLAGGHQPMPNQDGSTWIVFNGEIYNFQELREDLISRGHRFRSRSDTEVVLSAWEEFGQGCVEKLRGMFAFMIWDSRQQMLFGARDRLGIKPFYYHADSRTFAFASELKALLEAPHIQRNLDSASLAEYLHHRYVIAPNTMLEGIKKLPPAHTITVTQAGVSLARYWEIPIHPLGDTDEAKKLEELDALLKETIRLHLIADVPLGAFLSGGLDSSAIVAMMAKLGVRDIKTFSVGYDSPESELGYARIVANHFKTDHNELRLTPSAFREFLPQMVCSMDEPVGDEASIPLHYLSQFARKKVTVALSGEGSDEIFGGYPIYRTMLALEAINRLPFAAAAGGASRFLADGKLKKYASMLGKPLESRYAGVSRVFSHEQIRHICPASAMNGHAESAIAQAYGHCRGAPALNQMAFVDLSTWLAEDLLVKADRMSMANSLELRVPFLDHKVVEFALRLPPRLKVRWNTGKYLLKRYLEPSLPHEIIGRTKKGFPVPTRAWFANELAAFARETLLASDGPAAQYFDRAEVRNLLDAHASWDRSGPIYALLVFDQWHRMFVRASVSPREPLAGALP